MDKNGVVYIFLYNAWQLYFTANSQQSMGSLEGDYAIPPDAQSNSSSSFSAADVSEPEHKLFKTSKHSSCGSTRPSMTPSTGDSTDIGGNRFCGHKCGYLSKLGGHGRVWKRRWFLLKEDCLSYYKSPVITLIIYCLK